MGFWKYIQVIVSDDRAGGIGPYNKFVALIEDVTVYLGFPYSGTTLHIRISYCWAYSSSSF